MFASSTPLRISAEDQETDISILWKSTGFLGENSFNFCLLPRSLLNATCFCILGFCLCPLGCLCAHAAGRWPQGGDNVKTPACSGTQLALPDSCDRAGVAPRQECCFPPSRWRVLTLLLLRETITKAPAESCHQRGVLCCPVLQWQGVP